MGQLVVRRPDDWGGRLRRLQVSVDGSQRAGLRPNEQVALEVAAGSHVVTARMDWARSPALTVEVPDGPAVMVEVSFPYAAVFAAFVHPSRAVRVDVVGGVRP